MDVLLLNASYEPLRVVPMKRAVVLILQEKAEIIEAATGYVRSTSISMPMPSVIKLRYYVKIPYHAKVALNRKNLVARDRGICQYCGGHGNTIDHVLPRSRGGRHDWANVVLACSPCNFRKGDKLLAELGWELKHIPQVPSAHTHLIVGLAKVDPCWESHLALA